MSQRSLGGYKFSSLVGKGGTAKRSQALAAKMKADMAARRALFSSNRLSGTTQQALRTGGWANPSRGGELKYIDVGSNTQTLTAGVFTFSAGALLNGCIQGSDATNRIGRKIVIKSLLLRGDVRLSTTSVGGSPVRILVVYDKQANATAPAITDILDVDAYTGRMNLNNRDRFVILMDFITDPISINGNFCQNVKIYKKCNLESVFNSGNAGTVGDITSGSIYLFAAQTGNITTANASFVFRSRIRFLDS